MSPDTELRCPGGPIHPDSGLFAVVSHNAIIDLKKLQGRLQRDARGISGRVARLYCQGERVVVNHQSADLPAIVCDRVALRPSAWIGHPRIAPVVADDIPRYGMH